MGCGSSKDRPLSARSWMASDGWIPNHAEEFPQEKSQDGKVMHEETAVEKPKTVEAPAAEPIETRNIGEGSFGITDKQTVTDKVNQLRDGELYTDDDFPANDSSLFFSGRNDGDITWKSPQDLVSEPKLLVGGESRADVMQGQLGDCWFLSSCAALATRKEFIDKVIPEKQSLFGSDYKGVVMFKFWRFGQWVEVFVDDKLPTKNDKLMYARNSESNEFWVALVEKAYAKLHGSYEAIEGGQAMDALVDLTGGIAERYELTSHTQELYQKLAKASANGSFITCSRKGDWKVSQQNNNEVEQNGLVAGHAYTVSDVKRIKRKNGAECLLRIRNPWGGGEEWKGAWADKDHRWNLVDDETKQWLQFVQKEDGEFWMCFKDFCQNFLEVTICTVGPDFQGDGVADGAATILMAQGNWIKDQTAGGCRNDIYSFSVNPQYLLTVFEKDDNDPSLLKHEQSLDTCNVIITLMQEHRRSEKDVAVKMLQIGFVIYATSDPEQRLPVDHFLYNYETAKSGTYVNFREVTGRFELDPGYYIVIPSTFNKGDEGTFLIRAFSSKRISLQQLPDHTGPPPVPGEEDHHDIMPPPVTEAHPANFPFDPHQGNDENQWDPEIANAVKDDLKQNGKDEPTPSFEREMQERPRSQTRPPSQSGRPSSQTVRPPSQGGQPQTQPDGAPSETATTPNSDSKDKKSKKNKKSKS